MKTVIAIALLVASACAGAQVHVSGYVKKDGTYVAPAMRSAPNNTQTDNYSTKGNTNPYNGKAGTEEAQSTYASPPVKHVAPNRDSAYQPRK